MDNQELFNRIDPLMQHIYECLEKSQYWSFPADTINQMFSLHNEAYFGMHREISKNCTACRQRVKDRLTHWWSDRGGHYIPKL